MNLKLYSFNTLLKELADKRQLPITDEIVKAKLKYESPDLMCVTGNEIRKFD